MLRKVFDLLDDWLGPARTAAVWLSARVENG